jgi:hypothetical protein
MDSATFPFRFDPVFRLAARLVGVTPENSELVIHQDELVVRFGRWRVNTPLSNIVSTSVTGPYSWPKVIGPPHLSLADRGLTFATNPDQGVCIHFDKPVTGADPLGLLRHPALTVTVKDVAALAELLDRSSHDLDRTHGSTDEVTAADLVEESVTELHSMTSAELRQRARELGVSGTSRMNKAQLVEVLSP